MSTPTTLSYLVQFKTDLRPLDAAVNWLNQAQQRVRQYNATMQNGAAAVNNALQAAAGYFAVGALRGYVAEAVDARKAQSQLDQALRKSGTYSAEYSKELARQADELEALTGVDSTRVAAIQRELTLAKVKKEDMAALTGLTLDLAAAREVEAGAASKVISQTLRGDTDSIRGLGIELDLSKGRVEALKEALGRFRGQAIESQEALPQGMRDFAKASGDAQKAAGNLLIEFGSPALEGFSKGLKETEDWLRRVTSSSSGTATMVRRITSAIGEFVGGHLTKILALAAGFLALKGGIYAVQQVSVTLGATWMALTGQQFLPMIASVQALSREFGLLKAATLTWQGALGTAALVVADFAVFYQLGKYLGNLPWKAVEEQQRRIYQEVNGVTDAFVAQWDKVKTLAEADALRLKQAEEYKKTQAEIAALESKKAKAPELSKATAAQFTRIDPHAVVPLPSGDGVSGFSAADEERLRNLQTQAEVMRTVTAAYSDAKTVAQKVEWNKPQAEKDAEILSQQLKLKRELFEIENQLLAAQTARNQPEIDRLQRILEEKKLGEELKSQGTSAAAMVQSRLKVQDEARERARKEQADAFALATKQLQAELAGNRAEQDRLTLLEMEKKLRIEHQALGRGAEAEIQRRLATERVRLERESALAVLKAKSTAAEALLARVEAARGNITGSTLLDEITKRQRLTENTEEYRKALAAVINLKLEEAKLAKDPAEIAALDAQITALNAQGSTYGASDLQPTRAERAQQGYDNRENPTDHYQSAGAGMKGGAQDFVSSLGTAADNVAETVTGTLNAALSATSDLLYNAVFTATTFKDAWSNATMAVGQQFGRMAMDMVTKMIWRNTVERALTAIGVTTHVAGEVAKTTATQTGGGMRMLVWVKEALASVYKGAIAAFDALASIPYVGPFLGAAAMAAAIAGGVALVGKMSHADGGLITGAGGPRDDRIPAMLSNREYVIPAHRVEQFGVGFFDGIRNGTLNLAAMSGNAQSALVDRGSSIQAAANTQLSATPAAGGAPSTGSDAQADSRSLVLVDNRKTASRIKRGSQAETDVIEIGKQNRWNTWRRR